MRQFIRKAAIILMIAVFTFSGLPLDNVHATAKEDIPQLSDLSFYMKTSENCNLGEYKTRLTLRAVGNDENASEFDLIVPDYGIRFSAPKGNDGKSSRLTEFEISSKEGSGATIKVSYNQVITQYVKEGHTIEGLEKVTFDTLIYNHSYDDYFTVEVIPKGELQGKTYKVNIKPQVTISSIVVTDSKKHIRPFEQNKTYMGYHTIHPQYNEVTTDAVKEDTVAIRPASDYTFSSENKPVYTMTVDGELVELSDNTYKYIVPKSGNTTITVYATCEGYEASEPVTLVLESSESDNFPCISRYKMQKLTLNAGDTREVQVSLDNADKTGFTYQWESGNSKKMKPIEGATSSSCTIDTSQPVKGVMYKCRVSKNVNGRIYSAFTGIALANVTVNGGILSKPTIITQPQSAQYEVGSTAKALSVTAEGVRGGTIKYQWYRNTENNIENGIIIPNATKETYTPETTSEGTNYYYCVLQDTSNDKESEDVRSDIAEVKVVRAEEFSLEGAGTVEKPYLIQNYSDLCILRKFVNEKGYSFEKVHFKLTADINLDENWTPIGTTKDGSDDIDFGRNLRAFSGTIDGKNNDTIHTINVAEGGLPLFNYVRSATIKNLNIYGKKINGYGLINKYAIDYGDDGLYSTGCPKTVTIDNVTIKKGTSTLESGFIGGIASGENTVTIRNCKAEEGVTIGYDHNKASIGTFAGSFNGVMLNCTSAADVYGRANVGGLVGAKGQSMGSCSVSNCTFTGNVYATGIHAGGIIGSGYDGGGTAPNTPVVTIGNCKVTGTIKGANRVGGILGAEPGCEDCWKNGTGSINDNIFCGKIETTSENAVAGAIIGFLKSYNANQSIGSNYFVKNCGAKNGIGLVEIIHDESFDISKTGTAVSDTYMKSDTMLNKLNSSHSSFKNWIKGSDGYPAHSDKPVVYAIELSGEYKNKYFTGDEFSTEGMKIKGKLSDGSTRDILLSDDNLKFTGFNNNQRGVQTITVTYGVAKATYNVTVLYNDSQVQNISVYFTLLGDDIHPKAEATELNGPHTMAGNNLKTWIGTTKVEINNNTTVRDVFEKVLRENGYTWKNESGNYVQGITPKDGKELAEFTNGTKSGWMYTLNGTHPLLGVSEQFLNNNDVIVFHYTDDYTKEEGSDKWVTPGENKDVTTSGGAGSATTSSPTEVTVSNKTNADGTTESTAVVTVKKENQEEIIKQAKENNSKEIVLDVAASDSKGADNIQLELPKDMVNSIVKDTEATVTVKSEQGELTIDKETMAQISKDAKGTTITVIISKMKTATEEQKKLTGENTTVYKLTVKSGNEVISQFNGKITVKLPIPAALLDKTVAAVHFDSADKFTVMDGKRVTEAKKDYYVFDTTHFSEFGLVDAKEAGITVDDNVDKVDKVKEAKKIASKMKLTTVATKTKKKNVKVNVKMTKKTKTDIKALKDLGYNVKYSFYRSTKKNGSYKVAATKKANTYTYVKGKKAKRYCYKTQIRVYDKKGKLITKTTLKNSKYASRVWAK